jgi:hypothetical protein
VLQRNATDQPLDVWAAGTTVQPGDTIDWPDPIAGFEPVPGAPAEPEPSPPKTTRKSAAKTAGEESTS